ncbi:hypothetical protein BDR26DRAFT_876414 [Obelidium mucronatum]|nr:hypothetical protein BDR26DRAFT_876414 [Obelidium mucronatum]
MVGSRPSPNNLYPQNLNSHQTTTTTNSITAASSGISTPSAETPTRSWHARVTSNNTFQLDSFHSGNNLQRVPSDCTLLESSFSDCEELNEQQEAVFFGSEWSDRLLFTSLSEESERLENDEAEDATVYLNSAILSLSERSLEYVEDGDTGGTQDAEWPPAAVTPRVAADSWFNSHNSSWNINHAIYMEESELNEDGLDTVSGDDDSEGIPLEDSFDRNEDHLDELFYNLHGILGDNIISRELCGLELRQENSTETLADFSVDEDWRDDHSREEELVSEYASSLGMIAAEKNSTGSVNTNGIIRRNSLLRSLVKRGQNEELLFVEL